MALVYLRDLGYQILDRNWRMGHKELDIIALDSKELVAVEVKSRTEPILDSPERSVDRNKQRNLISAAHAYVRYKKLSFAVRFDIIWVSVKKDGSYNIRHYKDAFIPLL